MLQIPVNSSACFIHRPWLIFCQSLAILCWLIKGRSRRMMKRNGSSLSSSHFSVSSDNKSLKTKQHTQQGLSQIQGRSRRFLEVFHASDCFRILNPIFDRNEAFGVQADMRTNHCNAQIIHIFSKPMRQTPSFQYKNFCIWFWDNLLSPFFCLLR